MILCSVKRLAENESPHNLSFVQNGWTFALDFANTINFKDGFKHSDYKSGDKIAAVGIGGLVAGSLGVKSLAKAGVLAKILPFLVKFWWVILAPIVGLIGIFSNRKKGEEIVQKKKRNRRKKKD